MKLGEIDGVKFLARKSGGVNFWTISMSEVCIQICDGGIPGIPYFLKSESFYGNVLSEMY